MPQQPSDEHLKTSLLDLAAERELERYKRKVARRTQEIRDSGDRWLEKLAKMPRNSGKRFDLDGNR